VAYLEKDLRRVKVHATIPPPQESKVKPSAKKKRAAHMRTVEGTAIKTARRKLKAAQQKFEDQILHESQR
jgi:DNA-binding transcriptional regulator YiaG